MKISQKKNIVEHTKNIVPTFLFCVVSKTPAMLERFSYIQKNSHNVDLAMDEKNYLGTRYSIDNITRTQKHILDVLLQIRKKKNIPPEGTFLFLPISFDDNPRFRRLPDAQKHRNVSIFYVDGKAIWCLSQDDGYACPATTLFLCTTGIVYASPLEVMTIARHIDDLQALKDGKKDRTEYTIV